MSDFTLIEILNLVRAEIARTEIGDVKRITGPTGEQGPMGKTGPQGPQGPRGNDGKQGPVGSKGDQGKKGDKGVKGSDGGDGVGISRIDQDSVDGSVVMYLTDGTSYTVEMPLMDSEGNLSKEVHYKSGGSGGGSGMIDLSHFVKRPTGMNNKWLVYRETDDSNQGEWTPVTTDLIETNPATFRDQKGRFAPAPEELDDLTDQRAVNEFLWKYTQEGSDGHEELKASHVNLQGIVENGLTLQASIEESLDLVTDKVAALEGAVGEHSLIFTSSNDNVREGQFNLKDGAMQLANAISSADYISLSSTDRDGNTVDLDRIAEGDVLRLSDISGQVAELKINSGAEGLFRFTQISGELDRLSEYPYDFVLLSSFDPAGLATIDYVDERDDTKLNLTGGKMSGLIDMGAQRIVNLAEPTHHTHAATRSYVDEKSKEAGGGKTPLPYAQPVQLVLWMYTEKNKEELGSNQFSVKINGEAIEVFLSPHINGQFYVPGRAINYSHAIGDCYATINEHDGSNVLGFKGNKWWFIQKTTTDGKTKYHNALNGTYYKPGLVTHPLVVGRYYALNFPSPFPFYYYSKDAFLNGTPETPSSYALDEDGNQMVPDDAPDMGEVYPDDAVDVEEG